MCLAYVPTLICWLAKRPVRGSEVEAGGFARKEE